MKEIKPPWVKWYAEKFLQGIAGLSVEEIGVYSLLLNLIYETNAPIKEDIPRLSARCRMRPSSFLKVLESLDALGKVIRVDGLISNPRAERELEVRSKVLETLRDNLHGSKTNLETKTNKINGHALTDGLASADPRSPGEKERDREKEKKVRERAPPAPPQPRKNGHSRGTRIDLDWKLTTDLELYARHKGLTARETKFEAEKFLLHYRKTTGDRALSQDWDASWQGWVLRACERLGREPTHFEHRKSGPETYTREDWVKVVEMYRKTTNWHPTHGPAPGSPGCLAPKDLVNPS